MTKINVVKAQLGVILILVVIYFLQVVTPLRLHPDTVILLSVAETAERGGGYLYHGQPTVFPPGYPALVAFLIRVSLAHVWVIVSINVVFVVIGLLAVRYILVSTGDSESSVLGVCILSLLSFVFIKYSAIPLTDTLFFGVSMCCLALMKKSVSSPPDWRRLIAIVVLVIASVCIRRIGVALIPALLYTVIFPSSRELYLRLSVGIKAAILLVGASFGAVIIWVVRTTSTVQDFSSIVKAHTVMDSALGILMFRLKELGEIAVNVPYVALPWMVQESIPVIGILAFALVLAGVAWRKERGLIETYFISYVAFILVWPFYDPRFWLPVIPFLIAYAGVALKRLVHAEVARQILAVYVMMFVTMGLVTLASNTVVSFSFSGFADTYGAGQYHSTYCAVWHCNESDSTVVDLDALHLLRYYK
jgi:hypothetical protein